MRSSYLVSTALLALALGAGAAAQAPSPASSDLPPGLIRQGNVIMMQPIGDSDVALPAQGLGGERKPGLVTYLSAADHALYERAFDLAASGRWADARALADTGRDPVATKIVQWRYLLDKNSGASFADISEFVKNNPDWPDRDTLFARAENAMDPAMEPHAVVAWFGDRNPVSAIGKIRLGEALSATGSPTRGNALIKEAWIEGSFDPTQTIAIEQRDGLALTPDSDRERLTHLMLRGDIEGAREEMARLDADARRIAEVALQLHASPSQGARMLGDLPETDRNDPVILLDQTRLLRQQSAFAAIPDLVIRSPTRELAKINPTRWWNELNLDAREALAHGDYRSAYALTSNTGLEASTSEYSEAQFLAGWIALRRMNDPHTALAHFQKLADAVTRPISQARAHFWEGRCYEAEGNFAEAWQQYRTASEYPETFYGQIALARIEPAPRLHLREASVDAAPLRSDYEREEMTHAIHVLGDLGLENLLRVFAVLDADNYPDARHVTLLASDLTAMGFREIAVRVAKEASYNGVKLLSYSHPVITVPAYAGADAAPETAFVLGIIRQETEFDPNAVSSAGARGIMQVMPYSARQNAELARVAYRPGALGGDTNYDMQLGMAELANELSEWGGSYVLAAATYNAGPGNVHKWIATFGDPRDTRTDPIDWIEEIPFNETRNYVQRVMENMEVYRNRLSGRDEPLTILPDIYRPNAPQLGPLPYTPAAAIPQEPAMPVPAARPLTTVAQSDWHVVHPSAPAMSSTAIVELPSAPTPETTSIPDVVPKPKPPP